VTLGGCLTPNRFNLPAGPDDKSAARYAHERAAHEFFHAPGTVGSDGLVIRVAQKRKIQFTLELEICQSLHGIRAHADDRGIGFLEFSLCVAKLGRFDDSTGSIRFREEKEDHALARKILERERLARVRFQSELWRFITDFKHVRFHLD